MVYLWGAFGYVGWVGSSLVLRGFLKKAWAREERAKDAFDALVAHLDVVCPNPCVCGHDHIADEDSSDAGCRVCECSTWTAQA